MTNADLVKAILEIVMKEEKGSSNISEYKEDIGKNVFIKTVTHHYTGKIVKASGDIIVLDNAAWIASDGRLNESMKDPKKFDEVEPFPKPVKLNTGSFLLVTEIDFLPLEVK